MCYFDIYFLWCSEAVSKCRDKTETEKGSEGRGDAWAEMKHINQALLL